MTCWYLSTFFSNFDVSSLQQQSVAAAMMDHRLHLDSRGGGEELFERKLYDGGPSSRHSSLLGSSNGGLVSLSNGAGGVGHNWNGLNALDHSGARSGTVSQEHHHHPQQQQERHSLDRARQLPPAFDPLHSLARYRQQTRLDPGQGLQGNDGQQPVHDPHNLVREGQPGCYDHGNGLDSTGGQPMHDPSHSRGCDDKHRGPMGLAIARQTVNHVSLDKDGIFHSPRTSHLPDRDRGGQRVRNSSRKDIGQPEDAEQRPNLAGDGKPSADDGGGGYPGRESGLFPRRRYPDKDAGTWDGGQRSDNAVPGPAKIGEKEPDSRLEGRNNPNGMKTPAQPDGPPDGRSLGKTGTLLDGLDLSHFPPSHPLGLEEPEPRVKAEPMIRQPGEGQKLPGTKAKRKPKAKLGAGEGSGPGVPPNDAKEKARPYQCPVCHKVGAQFTKDATTLPRPCLPWPCLSIRLSYAYLVDNQSLKLVGSSRLFK